MGQEQGKPTYDKPADFVNVKRVNTGDKDSKGRDKYRFTIGLGTDKAGKEINNVDAMLVALAKYQGKQVNLTFHVEEKTDPKSGRKFPSAFLKIDEMIPKEAGTSSGTYTTKRTTSDDVKAQAEAIRAQFGSKS